MRALNIRGQIFWFLTAIEPVKHPVTGARIWRCSCRCGGKTFATAAQLRRLDKKSCGCLQTPESLLDKKFGKWTVIEGPIAGKRTRYRCRCACGTIALLDSSKLRTHLTNACRRCSGVGKIGHRRLPPGVALARKVFDNYRRSAALKGRAFDLTRDQALELMAQPCHYCGIPPTKTIARPECHGSFTYNGLDRIDNALGYTISNIFPCCTECNFKKGDQDYESFISWVKRVALRFSEVPEARPTDPWTPPVLKNIA